MAQVHTLVGKPASGPLESEEERGGVGVIEVASPVGVIFGLIPMTSPVSTIVFKTLVALKGRNALIFSCHLAQVGSVTGRERSSGPSCVRTVHRWTWCSGSTSGAAARRPKCSCATQTSP
jgi:hypothetical protein